MPNPFGIGDLPSMGLPGSNPGQSGGLFETMELMRKAWTAFALPPSVAPTVDPDEIERRIAELKTVEQWLVMNLTMLRGTIQALEIQQSTLAALRSFGATSAAAMSAASAAASAPARAAASAASGNETPVPASTGWPHSPAQVPDKAQAPAQSSSPAPQDQAGDSAASEAAEGRPALPQVNPLAWWETLQRQFNEVAAAALGSMPASAAGVGDAAQKTPADSSREARSRRSPASKGPARRPAAGSAEKKRAPATRRRPTSEG
jgi:hypothetical protein